MQTITNAPNKLVVQHRSMFMGSILFVGAVLWVVTVVSVAVWGAVSLSQQQPLPTFYTLRMFMLALVFAMGCFFAWVGAGTALNVWHGVTCAFDRANEQVTITRAAGFGTARQQHSIYGVSHALLEGNDDLRTLAIYLVLRSGQRIPLGTCSEFEKADAERAVQSIRAFLLGR